MYHFNEYVKASSIWPTAKDYDDKGNVPGLVRGYNIEVKTMDGRVDWLSSIYIHGEPNTYFNSEYNIWRYTDNGWTPTGRICFRGYGIEEYDPEERDLFIIPCDEKGNRTDKKDI